MQFGCKEYLVSLSNLRCVTVYLCACVCCFCRVAYSVDLIFCGQQKVACFVHMYWLDLPHVLNTTVLTYPCHSWLLLCVVVLVLSCFYAS
jgi:hypothetical protein